METRFTVLLAGAMLLAANATTFAQSGGKDLRAEPLDLTLFGKHFLAQKEKTPVLVVDNATITLAPGTKIINLLAVKTGQGMRVRLEIPGATIDAVRLRIDSIDVQVGGGWQRDD